MKKSIAIEDMFLEHDFYDRFRLAGEAGFSAVEFGQWVHLDITRIHDLQREFGLSVSCMDGSGGYAFNVPDEGGMFIEHLSQSIAVAKSFGCPNLLVRFDPQPGAGEAEGAAGQTLRDAVDRAGRSGVTLLLDPRRAVSRERPFLMAQEAVRRAGTSGLKLFCRVDTEDKTGADISGALQACADCVGYVRVSCSMDEEDMRLLKRILADEFGYDGFVSFENCGGDNDAECLEKARRF